MNKFKGSETTDRRAAYHQREEDNALSYLKVRLSDFRESRPITPPITADTLASTPAKPYGLVSAYNKMVAYNFGSKLNVNGTIVPRLIAASQSRLNTIFDSVSLGLTLRYLFLSMNPSDSTNLTGNTQLDSDTKNSLVSASRELTTTLPF